VLELRGVRAGYGASRSARDRLHRRRRRDHHHHRRQWGGQEHPPQAVSGVVGEDLGRLHLFCGRAIDRSEVETIVGKRLVQIPEGPSCSGPLSVEENLELVRTHAGEKALRCPPVGAGVHPVPPSAGTHASAGRTLSGRAADAGRGSALWPSHGCFCSTSLRWACAIVVRDIFTSLRRLNEEVSPWSWWSRMRGSR